MQTRPSGFLRFPQESPRATHAEAAPMAELITECKGGFVLSLANRAAWQKGARASFPIVYQSAMTLL